MKLRRLALPAAALTFGLVAGAGLMRAWDQRSGAHHADTASTNAGGPVDIGFAQFMGIHHEQAVVMAQALLDGGATRIGGLARSILTAQLLEIGQMRGWLLLWQQPLLPATREMDWMLLGPTPPDAALSQYLIACRSAPGGMPGLATGDELNRLRALDGDERDRLFLELMIRHHQGGLPMARFAARNAESFAVRAFAAQIVAHQTEEFGAMTLLLRKP